jgi:hypothetical protein
MKGKLQLKNGEIAHFIPAAPGWRIAITEHGGGPCTDVEPIIGWAVIYGSEPRIQPVFHYCGAAIPVGNLNHRDAYEILAPGQKITSQLKTRLQTEAAD